jgi:hypothetical protein
VFSFNHPVLVGFLQVLQHPPTSRKSDMTNFKSSKGEAHDIL